MGNLSLRNWSITTGGIKEWSIITCGCLEDMGYLQFTNNYSLILKVPGYLERSQHLESCPLNYENAFKIIISFKKKIHNLLINIEPADASVKLDYEYRKSNALIHTYFQFHINITHENAIEVPSWEPCLNWFCGNICSTSHVSITSAYTMRWSNA